MGCIYMATNRINGKCYIGKAKHGMECRRNGHEKTALQGATTLFHRALHKYGFDAFDWEEVYSDVANDDLNRLEIECIAWFGSKAPNGYNLTDGGDGGCTFLGKYHSKEAKIRMGVGMKCAWADLEVRKRHAAAAANPESKLRHREGLRKAHADPEYRIKISDILKRYCNKLEVRAIKSAAAKKSHARPEVNAKRSKATKKLWANPEVRAKRIEAMKIAQNRPEVKAKHKETNDRPEVKARRVEVQNRPDVQAKRSESLKKMWANPEVKAKRIEANAHPEVKVRRSKATKESWANPEVRVKRIEAMKIAQKKNVSCTSLVKESP